MKHGLAVYAGVAVFDEDSVGGESYNNFMIGAAFTADMNSLLLSIAPEFIIDDANDDNYLDVGLVSASENGQNPVRYLPAGYRGCCQQRQMAKTRWLVLVCVGNTTTV